MPIWKTVCFALFLVWGVPAGVVAQDDTFGAEPLSSKIWDDFSFSNLTSKGHKALGYAAVTLGTASLVTQAVGESPDSVLFLGRSAAIAGVTTVALGLVGHWDKLSFDGDVLTWHNLHGVTALAGAGALGVAAFSESAGPRSGWGLAGTLLLAAAIVLEG